MKETKVLGTLLPSIPEFQPMIQELREKYNLPEISLDDEPIKEIFTLIAPVAFIEIAFPLWLLIKGETIKIQP